jgi:hypothetical protein
MEHLGYIYICVYIYIYIWVNYNDLTGIIVNKGNPPQMALIQGSDIL